MEVKFYLRKNGQPKKVRPVWAETRTAPINEEEADPDEVNKVGISGKRIVAVGAVDGENVYLHPNWNQDECKFGNSGGGDVNSSTVDPSSCN
jgi:hypothetical protein